MNKEQQDLAWKYLPKDKRAEFKELYLNSNVGDCIYNTYDCGYTNALKDIFGHHNLTSDTEPEEMLHISRQAVIDKYAEIFWNKAPYLDNSPEALQCQSCLNVLKSLFGDKCLPDKELSVQVGDKVRVKGEDKVRVVRRILPDGCIMFGDKGNIYSLKDIEPYDEENNRNLSQNIANCDKSENNQLKDNMEEKELNLCELLKDCEGEEFFSISVGKVTFKAIYNYDDTHPVRTIRKDAVGNEYNVNFYFDGRRNNAGLQDLYPSEDLLRKYPLDAYSAWIEWKEERKPKRWRAEKYQGYYYIDIIGGRIVTKYDTDEREEPDNNKYNSYNYFRTKELAEQAAEVVREALQKFYEQK